MEMFNLYGRVAMVTGDTTGLGRGMAITPIRQGVDLTVLARRPGKLTETAREIGSLGGWCLPVVCDISSEASVQNAVEAVANHYKKMGTLVDNTGNGGLSTPTIDVPQGIFDKVTNLDLYSLFQVMEAFGKAMVEAGCGRIINIASAMGAVGNLGVSLAGYQAIKGGVINLTRATAAEWVIQGVTVNNICPGVFLSEPNGTDLMEEFQIFIKRMTPMQRADMPTDLNTVGDMDAAVVFLASEEPRYITDITLSCDGGWIRV